MGPHDDPSATSTPQHRSRAPGRAHPSGTHLPKPALNEGREGDTQRKSLSPEGSESGDGSSRRGCPCMLTPVCGTQRCPQTLPVPRCRIFIPFPQHPSCLLSILVMPLEKVRGNPSRPVRLFWCNEQPLYLIFQQCDSALTAPFLCCTKPRRQWLNAKPGRLFCMISMHRCRCGNAHVNIIYT